MKRGQKHAPQRQPAIPPHIAALGIVKSVRPDGSYVCIHDQEMTECDECAPLALLADEEASGQVPAGAAFETLPAFSSAQFGMMLDHNEPIIQARLVEDSPTRTEYQIHAEFPAPAVRPTLVHDPLIVAASPLGIDLQDPTPEQEVQAAADVAREFGIVPKRVAPGIASPAEPMPEDLSVACAALGLASEHVLTHAIRDDGSVSIITRGGARLAWPCTEEQRQAALALTDQQRDGLIRDDEGNILPRGKWRTTPHKF